MPTLNEAATLQKKENETSTAANKPRWNGLQPFRGTYQV
jgi:hypothetical protein